MFQSGIQLPAGTARFCWYGRYGWYFFRYEIGGSSVPDCWPVQYGIDNLDLITSLTLLWVEE